MIKVINGVRYNTDTATKVATYRSDWPVNDYSYYKENLYITAKGAWFIYGEGNGLSKYAERHGNVSGSGWSIRPLTKDEVMEWLENNDETELLERYFGEEIEDA